MKSILNLIVLTLLFGMVSCYPTLTVLTNKSDDTVILCINYKRPILVVENTKKGDKISEQEQGFCMEYLFNDLPYLNCNEKKQKELVFKTDNKGRMICASNEVKFEIYPQKSIFFNRIVKEKSYSILKEYASNIETVNIVQGTDTINYSSEEEVFNIFNDINDNMEFNGFE